MKIKIYNFFLIIVISASTTLTFYAFKYHLRVVHVVSDSMNPIFQRGDLIFVRSIPSIELKVNQIAVLPTLESENILVAHRVIKVNRNSNGELLISTKGDANPIADDDQKQIVSDQVPIYMGVIPISKVPGLIENRLLVANGLALLTVILLVLIFKNRKMKRGYYAKS